MLERLLMLPLYVIGLFLVLVACLDPDRANLITWLQGASDFPKIKLLLGAFLVVLLLAIAGAVISFLVIRPVIFVLVAGVSVGVGLLIDDGLRASALYLSAYHKAFFLLALMVIGGVFVLKETTDTKGLKR